MKIVQQLTKEPQILTLI